MIQPDNFWTILRESILVQALITLVCVVTLCVIYLRGGIPPDGLTQIIGVVIGFYFGQRSAARADSVLTKANLLAANPNSDNTIEKSK